jgi:2-polyprenyl-3-methyl-5-hydroxy-6-metoxy-1,4-benzoquinol methylase
MRVIDRSLNYGRHLIEAYLRSAAPYDCVLDIGAGSGSDLRIARDTCASAAMHAVECNPVHFDSLRALGARVHAIDIERQVLPLESESVDVILCNQILEHCKEAFWIWHEMSRVLRVGGSIILGVAS